MDMDMVHVTRSTRSTNLSQVSLVLQHGPCHFFPIADNKTTQQVHDSDMDMANADESIVPEHVSQLFA